MKTLYYDKKEHKEIDDRLANDIGLILISNRKPSHIEVDGEFLKTSLIEIKNEIEYQKPEEGYDLRNPAHKSVIWEFENEILLWFENNPDKKWEDYLIEKKAILDKRTILNPKLYTDLSNKWVAFNLLRNQREFMKQKENEGLDKLVEEKQELINSLSFPEDEIDVSKIPF